MSLTRENTALLMAAGAGAAAVLFALYAGQTKSAIKRSLSRNLLEYLQEEEEGDEQEWTQERARSAGEVKVSGARRLHSVVGYNVKLVAERAAAWEVMERVPPIPELEYTPTGVYTEASEDEVLWPLIEESQCLLVPGAYFGDEGKGKTVDAIARHPAVQVVARVNSGENAGHTVIGENGVKYDFHLCPSGLLTPGKVNVIGPECVMDPVSFMTREVKQLIDTKVPPRSPDCSTAHPSAARVPYPPNMAGAVPRPPLRGQRAPRVPAPQAARPDRLVGRAQPLHAAGDGAGARLQGHAARAAARPPLQRARRAGRLARAAGARPWHVLRRTQGAEHHGGGAAHQGARQRAGAGARARLHRGAG